MINFFEEGKKRRFMSCDKAEDELSVLISKDDTITFSTFRLADVSFWEGYRWHEPEVKQKANKK
jgi:hypothetical protein